MTRIVGRGRGGARNQTLWLAGLLALAVFAFGVAVPTAAAQTEPQAAPQAPAPGTSTPCVAILLPSVQGVDGNAANVATGIQQLFSQYLTGPSIRAVVLEARLASLASEEARQKQCDHILQATITHKRKSSGMFGKVLG